MAINKAFMNLNGAMDLIKMSKNPLAPIYEAITNSLEALAQRTGEHQKIAGEIEVRFYFSGLLADHKDLESIEIIDNGAGFIEENYNRFREFFDKSKGYDNRGTGRLQYFHRFHRIRIDSIFEEGGKFHQRTLDCHKTNFLAKESYEPSETIQNQITSVLLSEYSANSTEKDYFAQISIEEVASSIKNHFLLRFYLDKKKAGFQVPAIKIIFFENNEHLDERMIDPDSIPSPKSEGIIKIPYMKVGYAKSGKRELEIIKDKTEIIKWAHFVLDEAELGQNGIFLCSKDIPVQSIRFEKLKKNDHIKGSRFLTAFYGDVLDDSNNVSDSVDSFTFPDRKEIEQKLDDMFISSDQEYIIFDSIYEQVNKAIPGIYKDVVDIQQEQKRDIESIAKAHGIPTDAIEKAKIGISDTEFTITKKLYKAQSDELAEKGFKAKKLFESLKKLDPTTNDYQEDIKQKTEELSKLVEEQNKEELSRYIIRREMITNILKKIIDEELEYQINPKSPGKNKNRESLIHDLIFKRKSTSTHRLNDLWILNEEFMHFDGCSDVPLNQIKTDDGNLLLIDVPKESIDALNLKLSRRPDIFLYSNEEKCLLVEFKEPNVDLSDHLNQLTKYCTLIANFGAKKIRGFYCYLIGENINSIDLDGDYKETVNGDWIRSNIPIVSRDSNRNNIANAQIEIIKLSSVHARAHRRNKSFAEKLGIQELLQ